MNRIIFLLFVVLLAVPAGMLLGQHSFTPEEVADGGRLYGANCASCHGPKGDAVSGIELMTGKFKRASSDDDLAKLLRNGIPNTTMQPRRELSDMQAAEVVAYLRLMAISSGSPATAIAVPDLPPGDALRGKTVFEGRKGDCISCHRVGNNGSRFDPDLSGIGAPHGGTTAQTLAQKLLEPNALMTTANRYVRLVEKNGNALAGKLLNQDTFAIQILDAKERLATYQKSNLKDYSYMSPMPSYRIALT